MPSPGHPAVIYQSAVEHTWLFPHPETLRQKFRNVYADQFYTIVRGERVGVFVDWCGACISSPFFLTAFQD